jgi:hypothetical protein
MRLKRIAPLAKKLAVDVLDTPFAYTERGLVSGTCHEMLWYSQVTSRLRVQSLLAWSLTIY